MSITIRKAMRAFGFALLALTLSACATPEKKTWVGAGAGAAAGGIIGGIAGKGKGMVIGAAAGAALGGFIGNRMDKQTQELRKYAETRKTEDGIVTQLKGDLLFSTDSAALTQEAKDSLTEISAILVKYPEDIITVYGHTDSTGSSTHNQSLSEQRANAVKAFIISKGVPNQVVYSHGLGESTPVATNDTSQGRAKNRRVELQIQVDAETAKKLHKAES